MRTPLNGVKKERISITVDAELLEQIKIRAEEEDRSLSQFINRMLKREVRRVHKKDD